MSGTERKRVIRGFGIAVAVLVLLGLTAFTVYQCGGFAVAGPPSTAYASPVTVENILSGTGYVFRSETVLQASGAAVYDNYRTDGERVGNGALLTTSYACSDSSEAQRLQKQLAQIDERIAFLKLCDSLDGLHLSDAADLQKQISEAYDSVLASVTDGNIATASGEARRMLIALSKYGLLTGTSSGTASAVAALEQQRRELLGDVGRKIRSDVPGYFYGASWVDGYEELFSADTLLSMEADALAELLGREPEKVGYTAGKIVTDFLWYLAVPVSDADAASVTAGKSYSVSFGKGDTPFPMSLSAIKRVSDGSAILIFSCTRMPENFDFPRTGEVFVTVDTVTGYRVPNDALTEVDGVAGVYILDGSVVRFRKVNILAKYEQYSVAAERDPSLEDYRSYLNRDDRLILNTEGLSDGKYLN